MRAGAAGPARLAFVVSTYQWPEALDAVLRAFAQQSDASFALVVADDGSGPDTKALVDEWRSHFGRRLVHVWQPDEGFRLARVLNLGSLAVDADYLAFMHGESIPRRHFVRAIRSCIQPGWFVAGRRVDVSEELTGRVLADELPVHRWGMVEWVRSRRHVGSLIALTRRDRRRVGVEGVPEFLPHDRSYGYLLGVDRKDFERVNGYDTRFEGWGEEDVDIAVRLRRIGLRCGHAGPDGTLIHLWHESEIPAERANWHLLQATEQSDRIEAIEGLRELAESGPAAGHDEGVVAPSSVAER
ncbi:MAG TPA: galactosyltransferase-related protein [Gaiella sp.]|nr:galactosyltransferase-related protein [Gaiella sp.]